MKHNITHNALEHDTRVDGHRVYLTKIEHRILSELIDGKVKTRSTLLQLAFLASPDMKTRTVDMHMSRLKRKLGKAGKNIKTLHGIGYRLED